MTLSEHVKVSTSLLSSGIVQPGFGKVLILGASNRFVEDRRRYSSAASMLEDGFLSTDPEYVAALAIFSQSPTISDVMVGFRDTGVAQISTVTITGNDDGDYTVTLDAYGLEGSVSYTFAASGNTATQIKDGLVTLINAGTQAVTAASSGATTLTLSSDVAGVPHIATVTNLDDNMTVSVTTPNVGIPEDLARIDDVDQDWYALITTSRTDATIITASKTIEAMPKLYIAQSSASAIKSSAYSPSGTPTDVAAWAVRNGMERTSVWFHPTNTEFLDAAIAGRGLSESPGSITWKFRNLSGVPTTEYTATERSNMRGDNFQTGQGKRVNFYTTVQGASWTMEGTVASGEFIDVIVGIDWLNARIQTQVAALKEKNKKVPFTDRGIGLIVGTVQSVLTEGISAGVLAEDPLPNVTAPRAADVPSTEKAKRFLAGNYCVKWTATLSGAVHATEISGEVTA